MMNKQELAMLERAYVAEIDGAMSKHLGILQTKSKVAKKLVEDGLLQKVEHSFVDGIVIKGYLLTHAGRIAYCSTCDEG